MSSNIGTLILSAGAGLAVAYVAGNTAPLVAFGKDVIVDYRVVPDFDIANQRLTLRITPVISNPSAKTVYMEQPFVAIYRNQTTYSKNEPLVRSALSAKWFTIAANSDVTLDDIVLTLTATKVGMELASALINKTAPNLLIRKQTRVKASQTASPIVKNIVEALSFS